MMTALTEARTHAGLDRLLTAAEVARELAICRRTIQNLVYRGELTPVRLGRAVRFRSSEIARIQANGIRR